jgi:hypothetical protein
MTLPDPTSRTPEQTEALRQSRRRRSIALGLALFAVVMMFYLLTVVKLGPAIFMRDL